MMGFVLWWRRHFDPAYCPQSPDEHEHRYNCGEDYPEHCIYCGMSVKYEERPDRTKARSHWT